MQQPDLDAIAGRLKQDYRAQKVWLYGSCARGSADEDSDLDLLIVADTSESFFQRMATVRRMLRQEGRGFPISPIVLTPAELEERLQRGDQFIGDIVANGREL